MKAKKQTVEKIKMLNNDNFFILTENAPFGIIVIRGDGTYKYVNKKFINTFGYDLKDVPDGRTWFRKAYPDKEYRRKIISTWVEDLAIFKEKYKEGERTPYTFNVTCKDGSEKVVNFTPVELSNGETLVSCEDVTVRKEAESVLLKAHETLEKHVGERTAELEASNRKLLSIIEFLPDATFVIDKDRRVVAWNKALEEMTGVSKRDMIGKGDYSYAVPFYGEKRPILIDLLFEPNSKIENMYDKVDRKDNTVFVEVYTPKVYGGKGAYYWGIASLLFDKDGNVTGAIESLRNITEKKETENALKRSEEKYRQIFDNTIEGIFQTTSEGQFLSANPPLAKILGFSSPDEMLRICNDIAHEIYVDKEDRQQFLKRLNENETLQAFETRLYKKDRSIIWVSINARSVRDCSGKTLYYEGTIEDITQRKKAEETIRKLAYHDALTGLPNRPLFNDRLTLGMSNADRNKKSVVVMLLDLDKFKHINDTLGHNVGDMLLQSVSNRLTKILRKSDTVARMGGDEFLIMIPDVKMKDYADFVARKIIGSFYAPFMLKGHKINVTTSIGVAIYPDDGKDIETLIKTADIAMYEAKKAGRNNYRLFSECSLNLSYVSLP